MAPMKVNDFWISNHCVYICHFNMVPMFKAVTASPLQKAFRLYKFEIVNMAEGRATAFWKMD